jgi:TrmH family RNA methyltransferase
METITSRENAKIKYACAVRDSEKQRAADGLFFAEGPKLCLELAKSCTPRAMYATAAALAKTPELAQFDPAEIAPHVAEKLSGTKSNQGVFALFETPVPPADPPHFDAGGRAGPRQRGYAAAQRCRVRL